MARSTRLLLALALVLGALDVVFAQSNVTCASNSTKWYHDIVGESPCMTYYRLRSICNPSYQVPTFRSTTPGDNCDDQIADCCCNSVAWALSMLCMNCQQDNAASTNGIDAGTGAYQLYLSPSGHQCSPNFNQSLSNSIQSATCNKDVKLQNFLYQLFWGDGSWFYVYTEETATSAASAASNNASLYTSQGCPSPTSSSARPSATKTGSSSNHSSSHSSIGAAVGGAVGGVAALAILAALGFCFWKRRKTRASDEKAGTDLMAEPVRPFVGYSQAANTTTDFPRSESERPPYDPGSGSVTSAGAAGIGAMHGNMSRNGKNRSGHGPGGNEHSYTTSNVSASDRPHYPNPYSDHSGEQQQDGPRSDYSQQPSSAHDGPGTDYSQQPSSADDGPSSGSHYRLTQEQDYGPYNPQELQRSGTTRLPPAYNPEWSAQGHSVEPGAGAGQPRPRELPPTPGEGGPQSTGLPNKLVR